MAQEMRTEILDFQPLPSGWYITWEDDVIEACPGIVKVKYTLDGHEEIKFEAATTIGECELWPAAAIGGGTVVKFFYSKETPAGYGPV